MALHIVFDSKFTQKHLDVIIAKYWDQSFESEKIVFDLNITEWISAEEITFLFAWIRRLHLKGKEINVVLPFPYALEEGEHPSKIKRRKNRNFYLLSVWGMFDNLGLSDLAFKNIVDNYNSLINVSEFRNFGKKILPFKIVDTTYSSANKNDSVHKEFEKVKSGNRINEVLEASESKELFQLESDIIKLLDENDCYSPFENKVISEVIAKELVINSMEHTKEDESYFTTALHDKWEDSIASSNYFIDHFTKEKESTTLDFYRDKDLISNQMKGIPFQPLLHGSTEIDLDGYDEFKNQSYLEFTYMDFGEGIHTTLKEEYLKNRNDEKVKPFLSSKVQSKHIDSQVLEYAFLMQSSRDPFDRSIPYYELIPRGLYFVVDMVRRYKGLLVARSGHGKVIYDFSNRVKGRELNGTLSPYLERIYVAKDAILENESSTFFDGTMISIVLPQRKSVDFKKSSVRLDNPELNHYIFNPNDEESFPKLAFEPESYEYLNLSFQFNVAEQSNSDVFNDKNSINNALFKLINEKLKSLLNKNCLLFIDFDFIPVRHDVRKIISYLSNTPLVNEFTKVVLINLSDDEFQILRDYEEAIPDIIEEQAVPFLFKPIPCLRINKSESQEPRIEHIQWIGVRKKTDEQLLTKLFFGALEQVHIDKIEDKWLCEGNVIAKYDDRAYSIFSDFNDLIEQAKQTKLKELDNWIISRIDDGETIDSGEPQYCFLTTRGTYQTKYLSLYETLNYKYAAKYFAKYLLDKHIDNRIDLYNKDEKNIIPFQNLTSKEKYKVLESFKFTKMIAVTVSSQLLGVQMRNLIKDNDNYLFYRTQEYHQKNKDYQKRNREAIEKGDMPKNKMAKIKDCPEIIKLASYFSFDSEKPYGDIDSPDKVLIVNDVISTGSLVKRLIKGITEKGAETNGILTIADARKFENHESTEYESVPFGIHDKRLVSIISYEKNDRFNIRKLRDKPEKVTVVKRINPILNSVVSLMSDHTEKIKILFDKPEALISGTKESFRGYLDEKSEVFNKFSNPFSDDIFKLGHFKQEKKHTGYYTDMHKLFYDERGKTLLSLIAGKIKKNPDTLRMSDYETIKSNLIYAKNSLESIKLFKKLNEQDERLTELTESLTMFIKDMDESKSTSDTPEIPFEPDFIFHPVHSGIEEVSEDIFHEVFKTDKANIINLQRYNTRNGWRFPFPAKMLNEITKHKHILIIDSGALSGHSLIQLVDSISFLDVGRIDFISVVGRLDDFQREFYSRLRTIKVKHLKNEDESHATEALINLNILFGINLHIPPSLSNDTCPVCKEIAELKSILGNKKVTTETEKYIEHRMLNELQLYDGKTEIKEPCYLPTINDEIDYNNIFIMRDKLGKVDSYRFYADYFNPFDTLCDKIVDSSNPFNNSSKEDIKDFELILTCLLHEPELVGILKDLLVGVFNIIKGMIHQVVMEGSSLDKLNYNWTRYALVRLVVILNSQDNNENNKLYTPRQFEKLFNFSNEDDLALNYLSFLIGKEYYNYEGKKIEDRIDVVPILEHLYNQHSESKSKIRKIANSFIRDYKKTDLVHIKDALLNLKSFFSVKSAHNGHGELMNQFSITNAGLYNKIDENNRSEFVDAVSYIVPQLRIELFESLLFLKNDTKSIRFYDAEYKTLFNENQAYDKLDSIISNFNLLDSLVDNEVEYDNHLKNLLKDLSEFQTNYLGIEKSNKLYNFSSKFNVSLGAIIESVIIAMSESKPDNLTIKFNTAESENWVDIHQTFLEKAVKEILKNAFSFTKLMEENVELSIQTELEDHGKTSLIFIQNKAFSEPPNGRTNGLEDIKEIFEFFCDKDNISFEKEPRYIIKITFNKSRL